MTPSTLLHDIILHRKSPLFRYRQSGNSIGRCVCEWRVCDANTSVGRVVDTVESLEECETIYHGRGQ